MEIKLLRGPSKLGIKKVSTFNIFAAQMNYKVHECIWLKERKREQTFSSTNGFPIILAFIILFGNSSKSYSIP